MRSKGRLKTLMGGRRFALEAGQFVLLDNTRFYQMEMETEHRALDLMMPQSWLEKYLPDVGDHLAKPMDGREGWGAPLGGAARMPRGPARRAAPCPAR